MAMTVIWTGMTALSLVCALALGNESLLASAALEGAANAIQLGISMAGVLCLWMGVMDTIAANVSANLLGLGNAATPLGLEAARRMSRRTPGVAGDSLCMLVVCNTASIQLIPTTVAAVRMAAGCQTPFDILPAVWITSILSVLTGITAARICSKIWKD